MVNRNLLLLLCFVLLCSFHPVTAAASDDALTVRVGVYENPPKIFTDADGNVSGFWAEILAYIALDEGWTVQYVHGSWSECLERLENNEIDILPDVAYTAERAQTYQFADEVVYTSWATVYAREGSGIQSVIDLDGKNVAVLHGSVNADGPGGIKELAAAFNVECTFIEADSYARVFEMVKNGDADVGVTSKDHGYQYKADFNLTETAIIFQPSLLYFAFSKDSTRTPSLIAVTDLNVKNMKADSKSVYYEALGRWFRQETSATHTIPTWLIVSLAIVLGLAVMLAVGDSLLRFQVTSRTRELTQEVVRRTEAEIALGSSYERLEGLVQQRTAELEEANLHKSQFLANMSHELRTPLNSILGYTKLMLDGLEGDVTADQKEDLQTVYDNSKHLLSLVNDLLDLSKIEAGKFEILKEEYAVSDLIAQVVPTMQKLAMDKGLELTCSVEPGIDTLYADRNKTKQVLFNLLGNAVKFTAKGSVTLNIARGDGELVFSVVDTGTGIAPQDIGQLFQSYKQVGSAMLDGAEGTGLGLIISAQFVELQNGRIWVESALGQGSTFAFSLPDK